MKFRGLRRSTISPARDRLLFVRNGDPGDRQLARVPGHDRSFARPDHLRLSLVVDPADRLVGGRPFDPAGDVFGAAVGVTCADQDLLALADALERPGRQDLELLDARVAVAREAPRRRLIHSLKMRYSSELVPNRTPPLCAIAPDGFARNRLRPGSASSTRRPRSCLTMLK